MVWILNIFLKNNKECNIAIRVKHFTQDSDNNYYNLTGHDYIILDILQYDK